MRLTVTLADHGRPREAIPVRAIPLLTDQFVSADLISMALAGEDCSFRPGLTAYLASEEGALPIPCVDWFLILEQLKALDASLPQGAPGKYEWRHRSLAEIPAGTFVWADEFSEAYRRAFNSTLHLELYDEESLRADGEVRIPTALPGPMSEIALEGFSQSATTDESIATSAPIAVTLLRKRDALIAELIGVWPSIREDLSEGSRNGLSKAKRGGGNWCVQEAIQWGATKGKITKNKAASFIKADEGSEIAAILRANFGI